jgi:hypothetical protein
MAMGAFVEKIITSTRTSPSVGHVRFFMLGLVAAAVLVNYLDRAVLGIAAPAIQTEFALSPYSWVSYFPLFRGAILPRKSPPAFCSTASASVSSTGLHC